MKELLLVRDEEEEEEEEDEEEGGAMKEDVDESDVKADKEASDFEFKTGAEVGGEGIGDFSSIDDS